MKQKKVLIVGGTSGIGLALAKEARKQGARVTIASRFAVRKAAELREKLAFDGVT